MICVNELSKLYGSRAAVRSVSFQVSPGRVVGLLGPNGAGKSSTIRILTTLELPTSGSVSIAGFDVMQNPTEVRRRIGYLPDSAPLYPEMRVRSYLDYVAAIRGLSRKKARSAISETIELLRLEPLAGRICGNLSRGERQRVGLAQALVHQPDVLIMDEPATGLDPAEMREFWSLVAQFREKRTVLLSSHLLSEITQVCTDVIVIADGAVVLESPLEPAGSHQLLETMYLQAVGGKIEPVQRRAA